MSVLKIILDGGWPTRLQLAHSLLQHNVFVVRVLVQGGYESQPARDMKQQSSCHTISHIFGARSLRVQLDIWRTYGPFGPFRGFLAMAVMEYVHFTIVERSAQALFSRYWRHYAGERTVGNFVKGHKRCDAVAQLIAIVVSQPLLVIALRQVSQLVGGETVYDLPLSAVHHIYSHEGLCGFFSGLSARLIHSYYFVVVDFILDCCVRDLVFYQNQPGKCLINSWIECLRYPLQVVETRMMLNGSRLALSRDMAYQNPVQCLAALVFSKRAFRGLSLMILECVVSDVYKKLQ